MSRALTRDAAATNASTSPNPSLQKRGKEEKLLFSLVGFFLYPY